MTTLSATSKAMRGTKRVCAACEVRFYDLARKAIVCPSCGAPYMPAPRPMVQGAAHTRVIEKTAWRGKSAKPPRPKPGTRSERTISQPGAMSEEQGKEGDSVTEIVADDEIILEQELDDADLSGFVDQEVGEPKEQ